jgi:hypothetical protein
MWSIAAAGAADMARDLGDVARSLGQAGSDLARRWASRRLGAVQSYGRILSDYSAGRLTSRAAAGAYAKLAAEEAARYPADLIGMATDYASVVAKIAGVPIEASSTGAAAAPGPILDIDLSGVPGQVASREFTFENPHDVEAKVSFVASPYTDGDRELKAVPKFDPAAFVIPAHGEQKVMVTSKIDKRFFKSGQSYSAHAAVDGFDEMIIRIRLTPTGAV